MRILGITGGIGSGKSFICDLFINEGIPIFSFDDESKKLYELESVVDKMITLFGEDIYDFPTVCAKRSFICLGNEGRSRKHTLPKINKEKLANIIFNDDLKRVQLEKLLKPELMQVFYDKMYYYEYVENKKLVIVESATMVKTGLYKVFDEIIVVDSDIKERKEKTLKNRGISSEDFDNRVKMQLTVKEILETVRNVKHRVFKNKYIDIMTKIFVLDVIKENI